MMTSSRSQNARRKTDLLDGASIIIKKIDNSTTYTIPTGKVLKVHSIYKSGTGTEYVRVNGTNYVGHDTASKGQVSGLRLMSTNGIYTTPSLPTHTNVEAYTKAEYLFAVKAGQVLATSDTDDWYIYGHLVDA